jgi:hypothetical protein
VLIAILLDYFVERIGSPCQFGKTDQMLTQFSRQDWTDSDSLLSVSSLAVPGSASGSLGAETCPFPSTVQKYCLLFSMTQMHRAKGR